ncbi:MAG: sodium/solute symporter [Deltaproteobacteria bacterium]|jgi:SSS family solute:Na+ symporter|nr:sodium/solute symporter [Deltaproteobacteria bacterium]MBW2531794.1 sodium/solute symporter [Deltaproteobacteria bacterium]
MGESGPAVGTTLDYGIIVAYFVIVLGFGSLFGKFTKSTKDFFFGGQRFAWWIIAFSLVATTVGSYSFIKYSRVAYMHGLSASMSYTNDWFWMPLFMFVWLPVIYFSRVTSVPEFFERRFGPKVRALVTLVMLVYLLGYIGVNLVTMGKALHAMLGWEVNTAAWIVAGICAIYVTAGGQTSVIMTDLLQGILLLIAGIFLLLIGIHALGGLGDFWHALPVEHRAPLRPYNHPPEFNFVGVFWQDGVSQTMFAYFINQGMMMRFLACRSEKDGRKAITFTILGLMMLSMIAVCGAGWLGRAMVEKGMIDAVADPEDVFVVVAHYLCQPGVFGLLMAAVTAALMSTADTLINATSAVVVNDIWKPYVRADADDKHYLRVARVVTISSALIGMALVPVFASFKSIYQAHGAFTASITPPMAVVVILAICWKRYSTRAAFITLFGGIVAMVISILYPDVIAPFSFGVEKGGEGLKAWSYQRAAYGFIVTFALGVIAGLISPKAKLDQIRGLVWGTIADARRKYKGAEANHNVSKPVNLQIEIIDDLEPASTHMAAGFLGVTRHPVLVHEDDLKELGAFEGDLLMVAHPGLIQGGYLSAHVRVQGHAKKKGTIGVPQVLLDSAGFGRVKSLKAELLL